MSSSRPAQSTSNSVRSKQSARIAHTTVDAKLHADFEGSGSSFDYSSSVRVASVEEELDEVQQMRNTPDFFNKLVESIAPTMLLRRDINVCIVGDPSCAKSQFLKYTSSLVPRSVTSGKSSSAAGL